MEEEELERAQEPLGDDALVLVAIRFERSSIMALCVDFSAALSFEQAGLFISFDFGEHYFGFHFVESDWRWSILEQDCRA